jgi:hypothetical protein
MQKQQFTNGNFRGSRFALAALRKHEASIMATLHGILAELGIEQPAMHPEREASRQTSWITDEEFTPVEGKAYELAFGKIRHAGEERALIKRVRIDGPTRGQWFDLDEGRPLDSDLHAFNVRAFRELT